jgi:ATP phosphoribosyltransferase
MGFTNNSPRLLICLPKGRMEKLIINQLNQSGFNFSKDASRSLMISDEENNIDLLPLKSSDILTFVKRGIADYGIVGRDILDETPKTFRVVNTFPIGVCRMSIAARKDFKLSEMRYLRIATKYPNQAKNVLKNLGMAGDVLMINSSVEIAPLLNLSDCILDIIETGKTLIDNGLEELFSVNTVSANLFKYSTNKTCPDSLIKALSAMEEISC